MSHESSAELPTDRPGILSQIGGVEGARAIAAAFYSRMPEEPLLRRVYAPHVRCAVESLGRFLVEAFGGPAEYTDRAPYLSLTDAHARFSLGPEERDAWLRCMQRAIADLGIGGDAARSLMGYFRLAAEHVAGAAGAPAGANAPIGDNAADPPRSCPRDEADSGAGVAAQGSELNESWGDQMLVERIVASARAGDAPLAIDLMRCAAAEGRFERAPGAHAGLLALLGASGDRRLCDYAESSLRANPSLASTRYGGRTPLHEAARCGAESLARLLIQLGADPNAADDGGHAPLYRASTAGVARALIEAGAQIDANGGVKRCTALHMAARFGNCELACELVDSGADIEARDSAGQTPLRRAVNCGKVGVVELLLSRGARRDSVCSKGLTPLDAARTPAVRDLLVATKRVPQP